MPDPVESEKKELEKVQEIEVTDKELETYLGDTSQDEHFTEKERVEWFKFRYNLIQNEHKQLRESLSEARYAGDKETEQRLQQVAKLNLKRRKFIVRELTLLGEKVEDPFIPKADVAKG